MADFPDVDMLDICGTREDNISESQRKVIDYIDTTFSKIIKDTESRPCGTPAVILRRLLSIRPRLDETGQQLDWEITDREVVYSFPGKTKAEAWRFACVGKILSEIYCAILDGVIVTKREIYYRDVELFKKQETVDRFIDDIAHTCKVRRKDLNVEASPKGIFVDGREDSNAIRLTSEPLIARTDDKPLGWILVVEKEATFRNMVEHNLHRKCSIGCGLLITGKGYPDLATRHFIRQCMDATLEPKPPVLGFFDCDPDGINIMRVYQTGSKASMPALVDTVPEMIWLGLKPNDMFAYAEDNSITIPLTPRDRRRGQSMLDDLCNGVGHGVNNVRGDECRSALQLTLMSGRKFEMEVLDDRHGGIVAWMESRIAQELMKRGV